MHTGIAAFSRNKGHVEQLQREHVCMCVLVMALCKKHMWALGPPGEIERSQKTHSFCVFTLTEDTFMPLRIYAVYCITSTGEAQHEFDWLHIHPSRYKGPCVCSRTWISIAMSDKVTVTQTVIRARWATANLLVTMAPSRPALFTLLHRTTLPRLLFVINKWCNWMR